MAASVTKALSHDASSGERNVTGVHGSVKGNNNSVNGAWKCKGYAQKCNRCTAS